MKRGQQELPLPMWGGARKGAGRKRKASRPQVPHAPREKFRKGALHATLRMRGEVWNLRTRRCFRALRHAFEQGCERFGVRVIHFSVQGNHIHMIVEAADPGSLGRAMKGLEVRMARALNKVMNRCGPVFADRYHSHLLRTPREAAHAVRYVLENQVVHARRGGWAIPRGVDPYCSAAPHDHGPPLVVEPLWWMLRVGVARASTSRRAA
ncbi:MAG TPA: transposase [Myxococcales bacterium]|nr:transposase [Myxococcales bacterium]